MKLYMKIHIKPCADSTTIFNLVSQFRIDPPRFPTFEPTYQYVTIPQTKVSLYNYKYIYLTYVLSSLR